MVVRERSVFSSEQTYPRRAASVSTDFSTKRHFQGLTNQINPGFTDIHLSNGYDNMPFTQTNYVNEQPYSYSKTTTYSSSSQPDNRRQTWTIPSFGRTTTTTRTLRPTNDSEINVYFDSNSTYADPHIYRGRDGFSINDAPVNSGYRAQYINEPAYSYTRSRAISVPPVYETYRSTPNYYSQYFDNVETHDVPYRVATRVTAAPTHILGGQFYHDYDTSALLPFSSEVYPSSRSVEPLSTSVLLENGPGQSRITSYIRNKPPSGSKYGQSQLLSQPIYSSNLNDYPETHLSSYQLPSYRNQSPSLSHYRAPSVSGANYSGRTNLRSKSYTGGAGGGLPPRPYSMANRSQYNYRPVNTLAYGQDQDELYHPSFSAPLNSRRPGSISLSRPTAYSYGNKDYDATTSGIPNNFRKEDRSDREKFVPGGGEKFKRSSSVPPMSMVNYRNVRPPISDTRRKCRDLICKTRQDPNYYAQ